MINLSYFWISAALRPLILFWLIASTTSNAPSYSLSRIRTSVRGEHAPRAPRKFQAITNLRVFSSSCVHTRPANGLEEPDWLLLSREHSAHWHHDMVGSAETNRYIPNATRWS